ncbi:hypothetical protein SUDANB105_07273 [Streptomyces sp. enrichment culture]
MTTTPHEYDDERAPNHDRAADRPELPGLT